MRRFPPYALLFIALVLAGSGLTGCKSATKATEENPAMSEKQKTLIQKHKKSQDE